MSHNCLAVSTITLGQPYEGKMTLAKTPQSFSKDTRYADAHPVIGRRKSAVARLFIIRQGSRPKMWGRMIFFAGGRECCQHVVKLHMCNYCRDHDMKHGKANAACVESRSLSGFGHLSCTSDHVTTRAGYKRDFQLIELERRQQDPTKMTF